MSTTTTPILIRVEIDRAAAVLAGKNTYGPIDVPMPETLTEAQRATVLTLPYHSTNVDKNGFYALTPNGVRLAIGERPSERPVTLPPAVDASPETIARLLDAWPAAVEQARQDKTAEAIAHAHKILSGQSSTIDSLTRDEAQLIPAELRAQLEAREAEREAASDARRAKAQQEEDERRERTRLANEREAAEREKQKAARLEWIEAHGSSRLRRLVKEGIEHIAVYRDERLAHELPGWIWEPAEMETDAPRNAPVEALDLLDEARKVAPKARLFYFTQKPKRGAEDYYYDGETRGYVVQVEFFKDRWAMLPPILVETVTDDC